MAQSPVRQVGTQVRGAVLSHYEEVSKRVGLNPLPLLRQMGLSRSLLTTPTQLFPVVKAVQLLEYSAKESGCPTFGLLMAEARHLSDFGPISLLLTHQPSLRSALSTIMDYRHLLNESLAMFIEDSGKTTLIREEVVTEQSGSIRQATELALGALMLIFRAILGPTWAAKSIHFTHSTPSDLQVYRRVFNCPIQFDSQFNGLVCLTADLDRPNTQANAVMAKYAQSFMDAMPRDGQRSIVSEVRKSIYLLLPMGRASVEQISQGLGMNVRTLQRRLDESQVSFSDLINDVRSELAQRYILNTQHSLSRVAEQLGYSNLSSFTRWFTLQFGFSPNQMRKNTLANTHGTERKI
jgi:AraC-like DNA-binding protein